jgi:dTMP kinase
MSSPRIIPGGLFISFEGPECAGKSTQSQRLEVSLRDMGYRVLKTREPGGTEVGEQLRHIVKHVCGEEAVCDEAELLIFCASRAQLMRKVILPFLSEGGVVICDRFADSTTAYQGAGRGFTPETLAPLHDLATTGRWPDLTFLLDLDVDIVLQRGQMRLETLFVQDRIEDESKRFHETVRQAFLKLAEDNADRFRVLDARLDRDVLEKQIMSNVTPFLS